jgi:hypothetical protein
MLHLIFAQNRTEVKNEIAWNEDDLFRSRYKIEISEQIRLYADVHAEPQEPSVCFRLRYKLDISISQINRIRQEWGLARKPGRPRKKHAPKPPSQIETLLPQAGVSLFARWLKVSGRLTPVFAKLHGTIDEYRAEHPQENFRLLRSHYETIELKYQSLLVLPLLDIKKLSEIDYKAPNLSAVVGDHYGSSTLTQYLGELERVGAAGLKEVLATEAVGRFCYIDGHMLAFWSRRKMHKGKMTMLGRIMGGTKMVLAHDEASNTIGLDTYPPDRHLTKIVDEYCAKMAATTGLTDFIIDREVNSVDIARLFVERGWGLICLLDANEYDNFDSFNRHFAGHMEDGSTLYWATWKTARPGDPRQFVLVQETQRLLAYWATPNLALELSAKEVVTSYRQRADIQENGIKHMIAHCALDINFGTKVIWGPDRMQARDLADLQSRQTKLQAKERKLARLVATQLDKIQDSEASGHGRLLAKREAKLGQYQSQQRQLQGRLASLEDQKIKLGEPTQRADRDLRKQTIMAFRSLWLENAIRTFFALISSFLTAPLDLEIGLELFFFRLGFLVETESKVVYYMNDKNLSSQYQNILHQLIAGFNALALCQHGKQLQVEIASPP